MLDGRPLSLWDRVRNPHSFTSKVLQNLQGQFLGAVENHDYGNQFILNEYCGVARKYRIPGRLQHGWEELNRERGYYKNNFVDTFVWSVTGLNWPKSQGWNNFHSIGAPWLYLLEILNSYGWPSETSSNSMSTKANQFSIDNLWVFGYHSTSESNWDVNQLKSFLELVRTSSSEEEKNVILLAFSDFQFALKYLRNQVEKIRNSGIDVVTIGPRRGTASADGHLLQIYSLLKQVRRIKIDYPSSLVFYGLSIGVPITWIKNDNYKRALSLAIEAQNLDLFDCLNRDNLNANEWRSFSYRNLGHESMKSPIQLKQLFHWNSYSSSIFHRYFAGTRMLIDTMTQSKKIARIVSRRT